ncbi:MAG: glycosyltransferase [Nitrosospira sp.]|nr:glycosyltransferase [Nitrosospira sp.]
MKILHIITDLNNGGAEAVLFRLVGADTADTHIIISLLDAGYYGERLLVVGAAGVHTLDMPRGRLTFRGIVKLFRLVRATKPDVVQTWMYHANLLGGLIARFAGVRALVWGLHNTDLDPKTISRMTRLVAKLGGLVAGSLPCSIISCSEMAIEVHAAIGYPRHKMRVLPNGYNLDVFCPDSVSRERLRACWGVERDTVLVGMVARWDPQKDHANLIAALTLLARQQSSIFRCALIGPGITSENEKLVTMLNAQNVLAQVLLIGPHDDIPAVMNALDLHILSSCASEAFPNVVAEAMACGTPAVVTAVGDSALIVGDCGWVVPPNDSARLSAAISDAVAEMNDPDTWQVRKQVSRDRVMEKFGLARMTVAYRAVWQESIAEKRAM